MPSNENPKRGPSQEERRRYAANRPLGGGGVPGQSPKRLSQRPSTLQQVSGIIAIIMLVAMAISVLSSCFYQVPASNAAQLDVPTGQDIAPAPLTYDNARFLQRESGESLPTASQAAPDKTTADKLYVGVTGHYISGPFLIFWKANGGADVLGNPLSETFTENNHTVQLFEKALLEQHPEETDPKSQVQLGFLGRQLADARGQVFTATQATGNSATRTFFRETGQSVAGQFKTYWDKNNGVSLLGLPISGEIQQNGATRQYFERGVLELRQNDKQAQVQVVNAGLELLTLKGWERPTTLNMEMDIGSNEIYQGRTLALRLQADGPWQPQNLQGSVGDEVLKWLKVNDSYRAFKAFAPWDDPKIYTLKVAYNDAAGRSRNFDYPISLVKYNFDQQNLYLPSEKTDLTDESNDDYDNAQLNDAYHTYSPQLLWDGFWNWPAYGEITTQFAERRAYGDSNDYNLYHGGLDIAVPQGTPVAAPANGKVIYTGLLKARGNTISLDHGGGVTSYYFHLSKILVKPGDDIRKGQIMGLVGTTGRSNGPHLHWEVRVNGTITYPLLFVNLDLSPGWQ